MSGWVEVRAAGGCVRDEWLRRGDLLLIRLPQAAAVGEATNTGAAPLIEFAGLANTTRAFAGELARIAGRAGAPGEAFEIELTWLSGDWLTITSLPAVPGLTRRHDHDVSAQTLRGLQTAVEPAAGAPTSSLTPNAIRRAVATLEETAALLGPRMVEHDWSAQAWVLVDNDSEAHAQLVGELLADGASPAHPITTSRLRRTFIAYLVAPALVGTHHVQDGVTPLATGAPAPGLVGEIVAELSRRLDDPAHDDVDWGSVLVGLCQAVPVVIAAVLVRVGELADAPEGAQWRRVRRCALGLLDDLGVTAQVLASLAPDAGPSEHPENLLIVLG